MTSPRLGVAGLHQRNNISAWRAVLAVATVLALTGIPCQAQDSAVRSAITPDSMVPRPDSVRPDSVTVAPADTVPAPRRVPVDSAIGAACQASGGSSPDLLVVTFRPTATAEERAAVAQEVGGTLVGLSEYAAPGSWYLRVPGSAADRSVADRLIVLSPVLEVGATRCPS